MLKLDTDMYTITKDIPGGPVVRMIDDDLHLPPMGVSADRPATLGQRTGAALSLALIAGFVAYMAVSV